MDRKVRTQGRGFFPQVSHWYKLEVTEVWFWPESEGRLWGSAPVICIEGFVLELLFCIPSTCYFFTASTDCCGESISEWEWLCLSFRTSHSLVAAYVLREFQLGWGVTSQGLTVVHASCSGSRSRTLSSCASPASPSIPPSPDGQNPCPSQGWSLDRNSLLYATKCRVHITC